MATQNPIILNCMPPGNIDMPSASLSILKSYLEHQGYTVIIVYWNLLILDCIQKNTAICLENKTINDISVLPILPFLYHLNRGDKCKQQNLLEIFSGFLVQKYAPDSLDLVNEIIDLKVAIDALFETKLQQLLNKQQPCLFGISAKYSEWIYGLDLIRKAKKIMPELQTIIGGFTRQDAAFEFISINELIDFSTFGESENCLLRWMQATESSNPNFDGVPNLFYRRGEEISQNKLRMRVNPDFRENIFPDYSDYFSTHKNCTELKNMEPRLPLDGTRGCSWNRCRFCVATQGIHYFERSAKSLVNEMHHQYQEHGISSFYTTDDDFNSQDSDRLLNISEFLTENSSIENLSIETWLTPSNVNFTHLEFLNSLCDLKLKAGFESTSDLLLKKMQKKNRFIDNLLFLKNLYHQSPDFQITYSIIMGIPDESPEDVNDAIKNLDYLRFLIPKNVELCYNKFQMAQGSSYFKSASDSEKESYKADGFGLYASSEYVMDERRFLFFFNTKKILANDNLWTAFKAKEVEIKSQNSAYKIDQNSQSYIEFTNEQPIKTIVLSDLKIKLLEMLEHSIFTKPSILNQIKFTDFSESEIEESLTKLVEQKLLFFADDQYISILSH